MRTIFDKNPNSKIPILPNISPIGPPLEKVPKTAPENLKSILILVQWFYEKIFNGIQKFPSQIVVGNGATEIIYNFVKYLSTKKPKF